MSPLRLLITLLLIVFVIETMIMFLLPHMLPHMGGLREEFVDALLLAAFTAPFIWMLVARPLRMAAVSAVARSKTVLEEQKEFMESLVQNSAVPTFVLGADHGVILWNRACEELTGLKAEDMLGTNGHWRPFYGEKRPLLADMVLDGPNEDLVAGYNSFGKSNFIPDGLQAEGWYDNLNGRRRYIFFSAAPIRNGKGEVLAVIETLEEITERKNYEEQLEHQANHDRLTGLPNRNLLTDRLEQVILSSRRNDLQVLVFFIDLDYFKLINDTLGHDLGDQLLQEVAQRLTSCVRAGDTVARQGGDEFVVVVANQRGAEGAAKIGHALQDAISRAPYMIGGQELVVTCSIGISVFPRDGGNLQTLLKNADMAMYRAKEQGRNAIQFHADTMNAETLSRMTLEKHLRRALEREELLLYYQPKVSLLSGRMTGMEALLRWQSPELGMVSPATFIPVAEETGLIEEIGEWALAAACRQNKAWQDAGLAPLAVAVNLSARQFRQKELCGVIRRILKETGLDPSWLELEITESMVMQDMERVTAVLKELKALGIHLAMDDFGTGYSSLGYLRRFPFDKLKIDCSFVRDITSDPDCAAIANAVIAMAHSLHLTVVAEGVETEEHLQYLRMRNCDEMQGYYFSRPVPAVEFERLLREGRQLQFAAHDAGNFRKAVLVVDDNHEAASALQEVLSLEGYRVLTAGSGLEGLKLLATNRVAVVLSDQRMPGMSGSEFLARVKDVYPETVRIALSGYTDLKALSDAVNEGAIFKFLGKPWRADVLTEKVAEAFRLHESRAMN